MFLSAPGRSTIRHMASSAAAYATDSDVAGSAAASLSNTRTQPPSTPPRGTSKGKGLTSLTSQEASEYLNNLLALPSSRPFPPALALRILTHKSYIGSHVLGAGFRTRTQQNTQPAEGGAAHNARLAFLGKRAFKAYFLMFLHRAAMQTPRGLDGLQLGDIDERSDNLTHPLNLGREIGERWGLGDVMRWSSNAPVSPSRPQPMHALLLYLTSRPDLHVGFAGPVIERIASHTGRDGTGCTRRDHDAIRKSSRAQQ
jgi:hypothetical protein